MAFSFDPSPYFCPFEANYTPMEKKNSVAGCGFHSIGKQGG